MKYATKSRMAMAWMAAVGGSVWLASCGGGGGGDAPPPAAQAQIDLASVTRMLPEISRVVPICTRSTSTSPRPASANAQGPRPIRMLDARPVASAQVGRALTGTPPADTLGSCGGRMSYQNYSHTSGVTTGTLVLQDYCTRDAGGATTVVSGSIPFVNTGTPSASGPIFQRLEASSQGDITTVKKDSGGAVVSTERMSFTRFVYAAGNPGAAPTAARPDTVTMESAAVSSSAGKSYRQTGYSASMFETASGGEQMTVSGTGYRSDGSAYSISTSAPLVTDSSGNWVSGQLSFGGANGTAALATLVPGGTLQATMTVNGQPVTTGGACR